MRAMKDSGIEWIGQIPQEWKIGRVKHIYDVTLGKMLQPAPKSDEDELCAYMCAANINWHGVDLSVVKKMWFSEKDKETYRLAAGDLVVTEGGDVAVSCIWNDELPECYIQNAVHRVRPKSDASNRYLYYWLSTLKATGYIDLVCNKATLAHFTKDKFDSCVIPVVSADEQHAIVNYLDVKCAEIDALIAAKEKTNALLKERRQSIIYEAVTKGLNPDAPMKDSGIEWIGQIPEDWDVFPVKYLLDKNHPYPIGDGDHGMIKADDYLSEGIPYVRVLNLTWGDGLNLETLVYISEEMNNRIKNSELTPNDILIAKTGATIGKTAIVPESLPRSNTTSHVGKITISNDHDPKFFYYVMTSSVIQTQIQVLSAMQSTRPELGIDGLRNLLAVVPPVEKQRDIATYLDHQCTELNSAIATNASMIEKLKEYRQSVIYEAVTGKIEI